MRGMVLALGVALAGGGLAAETMAARKARLLTPARDFSQAEPFETFQGGAGTSRARADRNAFTHPSAALSRERRLDFALGKAVFDKLWVQSPSSTTSSDGLGPLYNARACQACHRRDGRGAPPAPGQAALAPMIVELAGPDGAADPALGAQLQDKAVSGLASEGAARLRYDAVAFTYPDGVAIALRQPRVTTTAALAPGVALKPRIPPALIGLGLVEAIAEADITAHADPEDVDGDGVSGRPHILPEGALGRFGWKADTPSLSVETATAFSNDMGLSTRLRPAAHGDCTASQALCRAAPHGDDAAAPEVGDALFERLVLYAANLAVPARRNAGEAAVLEGKRLFYQARCIACHIPKFATAADAAPAQRNQLIWPYSDFLLHDLGPGLADAAPSGAATASEWRTAPLWGIGLTETVSGQRAFLHDGRARSLEEAILWHGGEAEASRRHFVALPARDRAKLLTFLESL